MTRRLILLAACITLLIGSACGDGKKEDTAGPAATADTELGTPRALPTNAADDELTAALAQAADFGDGWEEGDASTATVATAYYCGEKVDEPDFSATVFFKKPLFVFGGESLARLESDSAVTDFIAEERARIASCGSMVSTDGDARTEWALSIVDRPLPGEGSLLVHGVTEGDGESYAAYVQRGDVLAVVVIAAPAGEVDVDEFVEIVSRVNERLDSVVDD